MMLKGKKERRSLRLLLDALTVVVMVLVLLTLPYAVTEVYGLKARKLILLIYLVVLAWFFAGLLIFWIVRYRQTSHDIETLREEIERTKPSSEVRQLWKTYCS